MAERDRADDAEPQLAGFLAKFTPEIEARAVAIIAAMRARLPGLNSRLQQ